jgi:hypothetical protein
MAAPWTTPAAVRESAGKKVAGWLSGYVAGAEFDPVRFPIRGPAAAELGDRYDEARRWAADWDRAARGPLRVEYKTVGGRSFGANDIPAAAWLDSYDHAWEATGSRAHARALAALAERTRSAHPALLPWLARRPLKALDLAGSWDRLLAVIGWVLARDTAGLYLRQVDIPGVDTKFIGRHRAVLAELLDLVLPPGRVNAAGDGFEERYGFLRKPGYVRFRCSTPVTGFTELSVRADELTAPPPGTRRAFIIENETTYLAFPLPPESIVIYGSGYAAGLLGPLSWLAGLDLVYWGDIDTHGLAILNRVRRRLPHARSILMDETTLLAHRTQWGIEPDPTSAALTHLTAAEQSLYQSLLNGTFGERLRLEQEFINFASVAAAAGAISNDDFRKDWTTGRPGPLPSQLVYAKHERDA